MLSSSDNTRRLPFFLLFLLFLSLPIFIRIFLLLLLLLLLLVVPVVRRCQQTLPAIHKPTEGNISGSDGASRHASNKQRNRSSRPLPVGPRNYPFPSPSLPDSSSNQEANLDSDSDSNSNLILMGWGGGGGEGVCDAMPALPVR